MNSRPGGNRDMARAAKRLIDKLTGQPRHYNAEDIVGSDDIREKLKAIKAEMAAGRERKEKSSGKQ